MTATVKHIHLQDHAQRQRALEQQAALREARREFFRGVRECLTVCLQFVGAAWLLWVAFNVARNI